MSSNLPPGVTESMIPGNRPEDMEHEALAEKLSEWRLQKAWDDKAISQLMYDAFLRGRKGYADFTLDELREEWGMWTEHEPPEEYEQSLDVGR